MLFSCFYTKHIICLKGQKLTIRKNYVKKIIYEKIINNKSQFYIWNYKKVYKFKIKYRT